MYKIFHTDYGIKLIFSGIITKLEMEQWLHDSKEELKDMPSEFSVFVDMRNLELLPASSQEAMKEGQMYYKNRGMIRSVVIFEADITSKQFKMIAKKTGILEGERYINSNENQQWEKEGLDWIREGIEPKIKSEHPIFAEE